MTLLPAIIEWSKDRPLWQQDALRRLVELPILGESDLEELVAICKAECSVVADAPPNAIPLSGLLDTPSSRTGNDVLITRVSDVRNVNALREDQALNVSVTGLTVVYGDNGAGKSGYVRVLKQVCRARGAKDVVHPNIYSDEVSPQSALVSFAARSRGGDQAAFEATTIAADLDTAEQSFTWTPGAAGPEALGQVSVFDSRSASVYVTEENPVAYLPHGTDLFPRLVRIVELVKAKLEYELDDLERTRERFETIATDTQVYETVQALHVKDARARIDSLANIGESDSARLDTLRADERRLKSEDPARRASDSRLKADRIKAARLRLVLTENAVSSASATKLIEARDALAVAREANALVSSEAFSDTPIGGVGSDAWRSLWAAAKQFAQKDAVPAQEFPPVGDGRAYCVLCQQELAEDALARLARFETFVKGEARRALDDASKIYTDLVSTLQKVDVSTIMDQELASELRAIDEKLADAFDGWAESITSEKALLLAVAEDELRRSEWKGTLSVPSSISEKMGDLESMLRAEADVYDSASDPQALKTVLSEIRELEARIELNRVLPRAHEEISRQSKKTLLKKCLASTNTAAITRQNTEILRDAVSQPLVDAFAEQLAALRLSHLPVQMAATRGEKGRAFHALTFQARSKGRVPKQDILSEGENRGIALAAFLAEVLLQESSSTVVFDDPVSSMDHGRRKHVAAEIVKIAQHRPVLVFTHDLPFLWMLQSEAEAGGVPIFARHFRRDSVGAGLITDDWPWDGQNVGARTGALKQMAQGFNRLYREDLPRYEEAIRWFYDLLRTAWERAVEEILLNGAIKRFDTDVQTQRLAKLHRVTEAQMTAFNLGYSRACDWVGGHDHAAALALPVPTPEEAAADIIAFESWVTEVRRQHQAK